MEYTEHSAFAHGGRHRGTGHNKNNRTARAERRLLLDKGRDKLFLLEFNHILTSLGNQNAVGALRGNVYAKANGIGINDAKDYLSRMMKETTITQDEFRRISALLDRYGRWR